MGSRDAARAQAYAAEKGIERAHGSYEELLADPEVDAVYIPLPNSMHVPWTITALQAGKHVLCEKPLARDPRLVEQAFDAAAAADRVLMEAFMWRFHPQTDELVRLVRSGAVGEVRYVHAAFAFGGIGGENVRLQKALEGGALMDVGCYCVSALRLLCGEPVRVSGEQVLGGDGVDVRFAGLMRFESDVVATFDCGMDVHRHQGIQIVGSEGSIARAAAVADVGGTEDRRRPRRGVRDARAARRGPLRGRTGRHGRGDRRDAPAPARARGVRRPGADDPGALRGRRSGSRRHAVKWLLRGLVLFRWVSQVVP